MPALANLHFYIVQVSTPLINFPGKRKRNMEKEKKKTATKTYATPMQVVPLRPKTTTVREMELIGVIDQKAPAPERTGRRGRGRRGAWVLPD